ncbi:SEC-C metal-binding domain-containing protein [Micromonospora sp. NPDC050397]|uniref:SEC-C metal-binding domain-containing protein n=1 Tax=Micromonospora sp. NPDC050397 TaxID=3364279 RepID=UPI00384CA496
MGGKDPCPCGSGRRFRPLLPGRWAVRRHARPLLPAGLIAPGVPYAAPPVGVPAVPATTVPCGVRSGEAGSEQVTGF